jgi:hypothetical protein
MSNHFNVRVIAGTGGEVVQQNPTKPEYGSIGFEQSAYKVNNGFLNIRRKVAYLAGTMDELNQFATTMQLKGGSEVPGCLYVVEQFAPYYENQAPKLNPQSGRAVLVDGAMVWSKTFYDPTGKASDVYQTGEITMGDVVVTSREASLQGLILS